MSRCSDRTVSHLATLDPRFRDQALHLVAHLRVSGFPAVISEARRSAARQAALYAQGRWRPGPIVTNTMTSKHVEGRAIDIDMCGYPPATVPQWVWDYAGRVGEHFGLTWGGRWRLRDYRHFEI